MGSFRNEVQTWMFGARTDEQRRGDRRRAAGQLGLLKLERECRTVKVGKRDVKAWRVCGTAEFVEHAQIVSRLAEEFSKVEGGTCTPGK